MNRIRIVLIHQNVICGGADKALIDLATLLDKDRFDVTVFAIQGGGEWEHLLTEAGIRLVNPYSCMKPERGVLDKVRNRLKEIGIEKRKKNHGIGLIPYCLHESFDIAVSFHINNYCCKAVFLPNTKTVKYIHGDVGTNPYFRERIEVAREYLPRFDRIVCVSETAKKSFSEMTGITKGVEFVFNPLNSADIIKKRMKYLPICPRNRIFARLDDSSGRKDSHDW